MSKVRLVQVAFIKHYSGSKNAHEAGRERHFKDFRNKGDA